MKLFQNAQSIARCATTTQNAMNAHRDTISMELLNVNVSRSKHLPSYVTSLYFVTKLCFCKLFIYLQNVQSIVLYAIMTQSAMNAHKGTTWMVWQNVNVSISIWHNWLK